MNREEGMLKVKSTVKPVSRNGPILRISENSSFCHFPFAVLETWYTKNIQMYISITIEPWHHKASYQNLLFCCNAQRERTSKDSCSEDTGSTLSTSSSPHIQSQSCSPSHGITRSIRFPRNPRVSVPKSLQPTVNLE